MTAVPAERRIKSELLAGVRGIPAGSVATVDLFAKTLGVIATVVVTLLAHLTEDERETTPWHRVVAKGGAIGRGPHRDAQFSKLVREGVPVSPAGIVQDMARVAVTTLAFSLPGTSKRPDIAPSLQPFSRSRGMKDRPS